MKANTCGHADRPHHARGKCITCYNATRPSRVAGEASPPREPEIEPLDVARLRRAEKRDQSRDKRALEAALSKLDGCERALDAFAELASVPCPAIAPASLNPARRTVVASHLLSDVHYGAIFPETASTYGNAVNPAITKLRIQRDFAAVAFKVRQHRMWADLPVLILSMLGDNVEGQLHEETLETAQPALQSMLEIYPIYLSSIRWLAHELAPIDIRVIGSWGNHGRDTHRVRFITGARHSVDWAIYQQLARDLRDDGINVHADEAMDQYVSVFGRPYHQQHGLSIGYQGGVGGLSIPLNKAAAQWDKRTPSTMINVLGDPSIADIMASYARGNAGVHMIGHWHQSLYGGRWFTNGSIKGYDPYVSNKNANPEQPKQWFFLIDSKRGPTELAELWCADREQELKLR